MKVLGWLVWLLDKQPGRRRSSQEFENRFLLFFSSSSSKSWWLRFCLGWVLHPKLWRWQRRSRAVVRGLGSRGGRPRGEVGDEVMDGRLTDDGGREAWSAH